MERISNIKDFCLKVYYSFPVQLLLNHFKKNQILLLLWFLLFSIITQNMFTMVGVPYLFLDPEYMNIVDYKGFFIIGVATGVFIMSFHITTYILDSFRFSFLGTVSKPFTKFSLNNSIIPFIFLIVYVVNIVKFQFKSGFQTRTEIFIEVISFLLGVFLILSILFSYFWSTNKDIFKELANNLDKQLKRNKISRVNVMNKLKSAKKNKYRVDYYFDGILRIERCSEQKLYDKQLLIKIFDQNHLNAVIVEAFVILVIIFLGFFMDHALVQIPAAASGILLLSIFVMFTGAFSYWLRGWALTAIIAILIIINFLVRNKYVDSDYRAYGIDYNATRPVYNLESIKALSSSENYKADYRETIEILENWKSKFPAGSKPKMIFICTSGGGQRAAVWTLRTLQHTDSTLGGNLMKNAFLITGASGGLVGASYFRELYLKKLKGDSVNLYSTDYLNNISRDILNPMIFSLVVNDIFFRFQNFEYQGNQYPKDRGYAFEQQLNQNLGNIFTDKKLSDYREPERKAEIPMMILSPTIINDGRKLYISPQNMSYMTGINGHDDSGYNSKIKGIEFRRFFSGQNADKLRFLSAIRMSATFPYVTPNVELPSDPEMEIMDAGLSDNFGIRDAVSFLFVFRKWIHENTGGVVFMIIRDSEKNGEIEKKTEPSVIQKITTPIGSLYTNWDYLQDFNNDQLLESAAGWFGGDFSVVDFEYIPKPRYWDKLIAKKIDPAEMEKKPRERAALSWHLTTREKESLSRTINEGNNQLSLSKLKTLITGE
jgi:hypothetical protein